MKCCGDRGEPDALQIFADRNLQEEKHKPDCVQDDVGGDQMKDHDLALFESYKILRRFDEATETKLKTDWSRLAGNDSGNC